MDKTDKKPYLILVASQKGGVGKTTIAINLAIALSYQDYKVMLVDSDIATFSVSEHLGIKASEEGFVEAVNGKAEIGDVIFSYEPLDLHLIMGGLSQSPEFPTPEDLTKFYAQLLKMDYDFIIIDSQPGFFNSNLAKYINDVLIVTTPDSPSAISSAKLSAYCERLKLGHRLVINKAGYSKFELDKEEVEKLFGDVAYASMPEDKIIPESLAKHKPAYMLDKGAPFAAAMELLSRVYILKVGEPVQNREMDEQRKRRGFFGRLAKWAAGPGK